MYFLDGRSQDDIARVLGTSRSNVSRMLSAARKLGIVEIRIQDEAGRDTDLEQALADRFGLAHVRVAAFRPRQDVLAATGALGAAWLADTVRDGQVVALSSGSALAAVVSAVSLQEPRDLEVVPLVGGQSAVGAALAGHELVRELARRLGATYHYLHVPALFRSESARSVLLAEPSVAHVMDQARSADIALVGIGSVGSWSSAQIVDSMGLTQAQHEAFLSRAPVGDVCFRFFDADGQQIAGAVHDHVLAIDLADLRRIPVVIGVASGSEKAPGVLGALRGTMLDGLIVDASLAHSILTADGAF